ncbi:cupin domain-containing protein [Antarctobacter heliothermus]|uniref:Cupin domain-containing protein n=1 Tax=Antarctobacter heliothermus TaxID=74033 RepID=A0A239GJ57_9RHOB|nr:cupin domain-containing protein [Antarctobacter heliothermus]SNS69031.1 Cupin domain-containing protein [Antarctobacter heliothermus]
MFRFAVACVALLAAAPAFASDLVLRDILQEQPLSDAPDMKVMITRVTVKPGGAVVEHIHPGDEHAVVLRGGTVLLTDGQEAEYAEGDVLFFSAGEMHGGLRNIGGTEIVLLTTHVVNVLEPFRWPAE